MIWRHRRAVVTGFGGMVVALFCAGPVRADDEDRNKAVATDLFDNGVRKMSAGQCDQSPIKERPACEEARDAFKRAYALYPAGLGALRNLAYVEQHLGLVASAARNFRELMRKAPLDPNPARRLWADFAKKEYEALAPRIPHLTIELPAERPAQMSLLLDGQPLPEAGWGTALEVDPGKHTVRAEAPEHAPFEQSFELAEEEEKQIAVSLTAIASAPAERSEPVEAAAPASIEQPKQKPRIVPLVVAGAGVVTLGVGLGLGYVAIQKRKDACGDGHFCEPDQLESGRSTARASTIVTSIGAATLAGGLIWYFLSAPPKTEKLRARVIPALGPRGGGLEAVGTF
jgi:hypothetical protein